MKRVGVVGMLSIILVGGICVKRVQRSSARPSYCYELSRRSYLASFSQEAKNRLDAFFALHHVSQENPLQFSKHLQELFPLLKKVAFAREGVRTVVTAHAASPLFVLNGSTVVAEGKRRIPCAEVAPGLVAELPHFTVSAEGKVPDCIAYAPALEPTIHAQYAVEWLDGSLIKFHDKRYPQVTVLGSAETKAADILQPACQELTLALLERKPARRGQKNEWVIDMRFKGQMIVFPGGKGTYEKAVCG